MFGGEKMFHIKKNIIQEIAIEKILPNPGQPRKVFNYEELKELSDSIKEIGVMQPIIARKNKDDTCILIAGERRLRAAKLAGLSKIPVIIKEIDNENMVLWALVENIQRENLNYIEEALAYKKLMKEYQLTQTEISKKVGKKQSTISNKLRILNLSEDVRNKLIKNHLTERHARALLKIENESERKDILDYIIDNKLNVQNTEKLIKNNKNLQNSPKRQPSIKKCIHYNIYLNTIKKAFKAIQEAEKNAEYAQEDKGEYVEIKIKIPKQELQNIQTNFT